MNDAALTILILSAEMVPFAKTGGLADVVGALPKALRTLGHDVRVVMPRYSHIDRERWGLHQVLPAFDVPVDEQLQPASILMTTTNADSGPVPVYMIDNAHYFERDGTYMYEDDGDRFVFFCRAALEGVKRLGWRPDVIHCHDWHTAIVCNWLKTLYRNDPFFAETACVFTIHNLAYQGIFGYRVLEIAGVEAYGFIVHPDMPSLNGVVDLMGRGIYYADIITTVSETYAREILETEFGEGLEPLLRDRRDRLFGVLNGIDTRLYDPLHDPHLAAPYHAGDIGGKRQCKADLQRAAGLPERPDTPVLVCISRLSAQKGFDLLDQVLEPLLREQQVQIVILGTGDQKYHDRLQSLSARFPEHLRVFFTFNADLTQKMFAGSDILLMPSRSEPCGLTQMIALRYGSIPVVRATGGLADTVCDADTNLHVGNGFVFCDYTAAALRDAIDRALVTYQVPERWHQLMRRAMEADHSWDASARRYVELYRMAQQMRGDE